MLIHAVMMLQDKVMKESSRDRRFSADMETVLRQIGIGDITIPKKMRRLAASSGALMQAYEEALAGGEEAVAAALVYGVASTQQPSGAASRRLAHYLTEAVRHVDAQSLAALADGDVEFPGPTPGEELGDA